MLQMLGFESVQLPPFDSPFEGDRSITPGGIEIGTALHDALPIYLSDADLRHGTLIAGRMGVGKSKLAEWILRQLLIRRSTNPDSGSTFVFDPHWSLARDVIDFAVACNLDIPILTLDPASEPVVAYDPIRSNPHLPAGVVADQFAAWMAHAWRRGDDEAAPLLESNLKLIVRTLLDAQLTLAQASLLVDPDTPASLRMEMTTRVRDSVLRAKWNRLLAMTAGAFINQMGSASRALSRLPERASLLLGQPRSFSFRHAMDARAFVFIRTNGEDGIGPTLASIMLDDLWSTVRSHGEGRPPVHVLIDEFTQLCGPHTVEMLNGGRKFDLRLILLMQSATQLKHMGELGRRAFSEVMLNCLNKVCMAVDTASAKAIVDDMGIPVRRLTKLARMQAMVHTMSMPPAVSVELATKPMLPMVMGCIERDVYLSRVLERTRVPYAYSRAVATTNVIQTTASAMPNARATPPDPVDDEPDEFTRVIRAAQ